MEAVLIILAGVVIYLTGRALIDTYFMRKHELVDKLTDKLEVDQDKG